MCDWACSTRHLFTDKCSLCVGRCKVNELCKVPCNGLMSKAEHALGDRPSRLQSIEQHKLEIVGGSLCYSHCVQRDIPQVGISPKEKLRLVAGLGGYCALCVYSPFLTCMRAVVCWVG